jgi:hypothetical protein
LDERSTRRIVHWRGRPSNAEGPPQNPSADPDQEPLDAIIVLADAGDQMFVLNAETGTRLTELTLEESQGSLKGIPLVTPDGYIALARQAYNESEAALMVFELRSGSTVSAPVASGEDPGDSSDESPSEAGAKPSILPTPGTERKKDGD